MHDSDLERLAARGAIDLSVGVNPMAIANQGAHVGEEVTSFPTQGNHFVDLHANPFPAPSGFFQVGPHTGESTQPHHHHQRRESYSDSDAESSA